MTSSAGDRVESLFVLATELPRESRESFLDRECGGDAALRKQLEGLLQAHDRVNHPLDRPLIPGETFSATCLAATPAIGTTIAGRYKLLEQIGEGGMGTVWVAEQTEPVRRKVALKLIKVGMDSKAVLARFEAERQALALMDHPNIAKVLDGGLTDAGRPYFVMEYVKGVPITEYCDSLKLSVSERLNLFVQVCSAVQHAHQKGIIHRDLKPSNILVAPYDDKPVPKVIDFGLAKALHQRLTERTLHTAHETVIGTPLYMSPEQAQLNNLDVDTRSDIYSLGVLLYELLTGTTPLENARFKEAAWDEIRRIIREEEPPRPSTRLSSTNTLPSLAACRQSDPMKLTQQLKGDLDWIVMKALDKERTRRYETATGLAKDVQRYLSGGAVEACPPTLGYRLSKMYRRNRTAVLVAASFALLLSVAALTSSLLAVRAVRAERLAAQERDEALRSQKEAETQRQLADAERVRAEQETQRAQAVRDFLREDLLRQASPILQAETRRLLGGEYTVHSNPTIRELLDRAAERLAPDRIEARFPGMPVVQAEVLATVGDTYSFLHEDARGTEVLRRAVEKYLDALGDEHPATLAARHSLGIALFWSGRTSEGLSVMEDVCAVRSRVLGPDHADTFTSRVQLGLMYNRAKVKDPVAYHRQLYNDALRAFGPQSSQSVHAGHGLAVALLGAARPDEAIEIIENGIEIASSLQVPKDHPYLVSGYCWLAHAYMDAGTPRKAVELLNPIFDQVSRSNNLIPLFEVTMALSRATRNMGRSSEAFDIMQRGLETAERAGLVRHLGAWMIRHELAWRRDMDSGNPAAALTLFEANLDAATTPEQTATTLNSIAECHKRIGNFEESLANFRRALERLLQAHSPDHRSWQSGMIRTRIGQALLGLSRYDEAEPHLVAGYTELIDHLGDMPDYDRPHFITARSEILDLYRKTNRQAAIQSWADTLIPELEQKIEHFRKQPSPSALAAMECVRTLGLAYVDAGRAEDAATLHGRVIEHLEVAGWPKDPVVVSALSDISEGMRAAGKEDLSTSMSQTLLAAMERRSNIPRNQVAREFFSLGLQHMQARRYDEATSYLRKALSYELEFSNESWNVVKYRLFLGEALFRSKAYADAEPVLLEAFDAAVQGINKAAHWEVHFPNTAAKFLAELYLATNRPEDAERWNAERAKHPERSAVRLSR
jgi:serine/threonine protein kinase/Tfp pilus assembly protein PilF